MNVFGKILSDFVTAREAHLCGERGSPAVSKGIVSLRSEYAPQSWGSGRATGNDGRSATNRRL